MEIEPTELIEDKLNVFSCDRWWRQFMESFYSTVGSELTSSSRINPDGTSARNLYYCLFEVADFIKSDDVKKREQIIQFIVLDELGMPNLLYLLQEIASVFPINNKVSAIFRECLNPRNGDLKSKAVKCLIEREYLNGILTSIRELNIIRKKCTKKEAKETLLQTNVNIFWAFSAIVQKDPKFGQKLNSLGQTRFMHKIIRDSLLILGARPESHTPYLKILRVMSKSSNAQKVLARDGVMNTFRRLLDTYNGTPSTLRFQIVLEVIAILTKSNRINCKRFLKAGLLLATMRIFGYWSYMKGRPLYRITKSVLNIYSSLAGTIAGKRVLLNSEALTAVRKFAENCPSDKLLDDIIFKSCSVIAQAYGKHRLPFKQLMSPARFKIPELPEGFKTTMNDDDSSSCSDEDDAGEDNLNGDDENEGDKDSDNSDVEPEDALGTTDNGDGDDSDESIADQSVCNPSSRKHSNASGDENMEIGINRFKQEKNTKPILKVKAQSVKNTKRIESSSTGSEKKKLANDEPVARKGSTNAVEIIARIVQTPLVKLVDFEHFFKEFDQPNEPFAHSEPPEHISKLSSNVLALLTDKLPMGLLGVIPSAEQIYLWKTDNQEYGDLPDMRKKYLAVARKVNSLIPFVKVAYPDITFAYHRKQVEPTVQSADRYTIRSKAIEIMARAAGSITFKPKVIYDLDTLLESRADDSDMVGSSGKRKSSLKSKKGDSKKAAPKRLGNSDERDVGKLDSKNDFLKFESRFESGNLRRVVQIGDREYDLYLSCDVNSTSHSQWFYFQVSNIIENTPYTFNIVNCVKQNSQFNFGMQPVVFSVAEALDGKPGWVRSGVNVCYHKNGFHQNLKKKTYYTASFTIVFHKRGDICYIAYHYPYTYTRLLIEIWKMMKVSLDQGNPCVRYDILCESLNGNEVPLLTITAPNSNRFPIERREIIVLSSRVHPGESNASWMMHGILHRLILGKSEELLKYYIFKIIPMLNVEGVINGCTRHGLTGEDLNRLWKNPNPILHPSIYNAKAMIEYSIRLRNKTPLLYCDLHGHSRKKNTFIFGCSKAQSWSTIDRNKKEDSNAHIALPEAIAKRSPTFALQYCSYDVKKNRESTARVALWRDFGIERSYTLESSYCGCDRGPYKGQSMGIGHLIECGEALAGACEDFMPPSAKRLLEYCIAKAAATPNQTKSVANFMVKAKNSNEARYTSNFASDTDLNPKQKKTARRAQRPKVPSAKKKGVKHKN